MMSLNRELVVFYITYKLSQRNFPLDHIRLLDGDMTDAATGTEAAAAGLDTRLIGPEAAAAGLDTRLIGPEAAGLDTRLIGTVNGSSPSPLPAPMPSPLPESTDTPSTPPPSAAPPVADLSAVKEALRDSANEFELRFSRAFSDLHRQLHITPATAYRSFESVMDEVFRDGVNWGRVVGLFAFGGALCVECVEKEMSPLVARIVEWMTVYLDNHIQDWITSQGGWARFAEIYGQDAAAESRRSQESLKKWLWAGMTLVTGVVVGSLIAQKRL